MTCIDIGIEYIRDHPGATSIDLSKVMGCLSKNVQPSLYLAISNGYLATTKQDGCNRYHISDDVPEGMSWEDYKARQRALKVSSPARPPRKAKVIVEKQERTQADVRNTLADIFNRRVLGFPAAEDDTTTSEAEADPSEAVEPETHGDEVIELVKAPDPASAIAAPTIPAIAPKSIAVPADEVLFLFGCDGRLQVNLVDRRIICTHQETASVGRMMRALEPVWNTDGSDTTPRLRG